MKKVIVCAALVASVAGFVACSDEGTIAGGTPSGDAGTLPDASTTDSGVDGGDDAPVDAGIRDRLLLSYNGASTSELVVFDLADKSVAGRLTYPGFIGATAAQGSEPFLLEQAVDVVARLDRAEPWIVRGSWDVKLNDRPDSGTPYADPNAVLISAGNKAYVLRYTRNQIAIIDPSESADAGAPKGTIDLSSFVQPEDSDGIVEMTAGVYVPSKRLVYVLLANIDRNAVSLDGWTLFCTETRPSVIAIDVDTDKVVPLTGGGKDGALRLRGYSPTFAAMSYDPASDRLLVVSSGCNQRLEGDDVGPLVQRGIEELSLFTGNANVLLDGTELGFPGAFVYVDAHRALVQFGGQTYVWDPAEPSLGAVLAKAPDVFTYDGAGNLLGLRTRYGDDGGVQGTDVVSVRIADGQSTTLGSNPFSLPVGYVGGVELWPPRKP
jgi:hypothetical protein